MDPRSIYRGARDSPLTCSSSYIEKKKYIYIIKIIREEGRGIVKEGRKEKKRKRKRKIIMKPVNCLSIQERALQGAVVEILREDCRKTRNGILMIAFSV